MTAGRIDQAIGQIQVLDIEDVRQGVEEGAQGDLFLLQGEPVLWTPAAPGGGGGEAFSVAGAGSGGLDAG
jgi:hypothetical protein